MKLAALFAAALACAMSARAQDVVAPDPAPPASLATVSGTAVDPSRLTPDSWHKIGSPFGSRDQWQVGFDKSVTVGSCAAYAVRAKFLMAGPCRDVLLLAKDAHPVFHLGAAVLYSASHTPGYVGRLGFNVGPATSAMLSAAADKIPYVEAISEWKAPKPLAYIGKISTFDYMVGVVGTQFDHGPQLKLDLPLDDVRAVLGL